MAVVKMLMDTDVAPDGINKMLAEKDQEYAFPDDVCINLVDGKRARIVKKETPESQGDKPKK